LKDGRAWGVRRYLVAAPNALYALTWTAPEAGLQELSGFLHEWGRALVTWR
jgi:hypothetical protein